MFSGSRGSAPAVGGGVLVPSLRGFERSVFRGTGYEAQDVLASVDRVEILELRPRRHFPFRESLARTLAWHDPTGYALSRNPGLVSVQLRHDYDLFVLYCQHKHLPELLYLNAIKGWTGRCRKSVCIVDEIWASEVDSLHRHLKLLRQFDLVVVGLEGSVEPLSRSIERTCHFVPAAVDVVRFSPLLRKPSPRHIDVCSIGRRQEKLHTKLQAFAEERGLFYMFDTYGGGTAFCPDHRQHRDMLGSMLRHTRCFMVAPALVDMLHKKNGQSEVANRYFEGTAAGAILVGRRPDRGYFDSLFGWPDSVIEVREDGSDAGEVISGLLADPTRCAMISQRNAVEAALHHDWVHRWKRIYELLDIKPTEAMESREVLLRGLAHASGAPPYDALSA